MHSSVFHFPFLPLFYQITSLSAPDILSICNPVFQLRADYTFIQLSSRVVTESDINFEWEVISGATPLDFINTDTSTPTVIADPAVVIDTVFKVYVDRGTDNEWSTEMTAFRTPTENATSILKSDTTTLIKTGLIVNGQSFDNSFRNNSVSPKDVTCIPSILSTFTKGTEVIASTENESFTAMISYRSNFYKAGHKIESISAYEPNTGNLIAATNFTSNTIEIPLNVSVFYLTFDVSLNYFNPKLPTKRVFISDEKVRSSYLREYQKEAQQLHLYVTEGIAPKITKGLSSSNNYNQIVDLSLPQSLAFLVNASLINKELSSKSSYNLQKTTFRPVSITIPTQLASNVSKNLSVNTVTNYVLTRLSGISIGG
jgi:hypothetical protein